MTRRLKISADLWVSMLKCTDPQTIRVSAHALPIDARFIRMEPDLDDQTVIVWIESDQWPPIGPLDLESPVITRIEEMREAMS